MFINSKPFEVILQFNLYICIEILNKLSFMRAKFRNLKIHTKYRIRKYDETKIPEIRLEGKWLESLGFKEVRPLR